MDLIRDIAKYSNYHPNSGQKGELFKLALEEHITRKKAIEIFENREKKGHFRVVYKQLKDRLLEGVLQIGHKHLPQVLKTRFQVWKKQLQTKILLQTESRRAGIKLAIETITSAEKNEQWDVVQSLCRELAYHYSISQPDTTQYRKYRGKLEKANKILAEELKADMIYQNLIHCYRIADEIQQLEAISKNNNQYRFRYFYYATKNVYFQITKQDDKLILNNREAYHFFNSLKRPIPYSTKFNFLADLIPVYILKKQFGEAESLINICLSLPIKGTFNWHKILIYQSLLG